MAYRPRYNGKYGNRRTEYNGTWYDSQKEADHAKDLDALRNAVNPRDRVVSVERQTKYDLVIRTSYIADFVVTYADGRTEVQDVKGYRTREYLRKRREMRKQHGIEITEI